MTNREQQQPAVAKKRKEWSTGFISSLILLALGVTLLSLLVGFIPAPVPESFEGSGDPEQIYSNWFYHVEYNPFGATTQQLDRMEPGLGFYLLMPVVMILLGVSGGTILLTDFQQTKRLIVLSWGSYLLPAILGIIKFIQLYSIYFWGNEVFTWSLGFYPVYTHLFLQLALLLNQQSFKDWAAFALEEEEKVTWSQLAHRLETSAIIFLLIYVCAWAGPPMILLVFPTPLILPLSFFTIIGCTFFFLLWFIVNELPKIISKRKKSDKHN